MSVEDVERYKLSDEYEKERGKYQLIKLDSASLGYVESLDYPIEAPDGTKIIPNKNNEKISRWRWSKEKLEWGIKNGFVVIKKDKNNNWAVYTKQYLNCDSDGNIKPRSIKPLGVISKYSTTQSNKYIDELFGYPVFNYSKPKEYIKFLVEISTSSSDLVLDFFAGSGTTGEAVMRLNAEDECNRKFILVQIDEPIKEDKPAYQFCIENNLPPVISSITIERLKRAGEKIKKEIEEENNKEGFFDENKKKTPDIGFKVFDTVDAPRLELAEDGKIKYPEINLDPLSRIYNMIFTVGLDEPTQTPEEVVKDCVYKVGDNYYITNSDKVSKEQFAECIKRGKVFIDGWTASLNATLQNYKEDIKIVF